MLMHFSPNFICSTDWVIFLIATLSKAELLGIRKMSRWPQGSGHRDFLSLWSDIWIKKPQFTSHLSFDANRVGDDTQNRDSLCIQNITL